MDPISNMAHIEVLSYFPGRARLQLTPTRLLSPNQWQNLQGQLASISGIQTVQINPVTGRVLILFGPSPAHDSAERLAAVVEGMLDGALALRSPANLPRPSPLGTLQGQAVSVLAYGIVFVYATVSHLLGGSSGITALSPVFLIWSGLNIGAGYPGLRRIIGRFPRIGRLGGPALVTAGLLITQAVIGNPIVSLTGLIVSISSLRHFEIQQQIARRKAALESVPTPAARLQSGEWAAREWQGLPSDLPELAGYARRMSALAFGTALVMAVSGNPLAGLAVLIVANPRAAYTSATVSTAAVFERLASRGIMVQRYQAVPRLARIENIVFDAPGILTASIPAISQIVVYKAGMTGEELAAYFHAAFGGLDLPVAKALAHYIREQGSGVIRQLTPKATRGRDVSGWIEGREVLAGSLSFLGANEVAIETARSDAAHFKLLQQEVYGLAIDGQLAGLIALGTASLPAAGRALEKLRTMGFYEPLVHREGCPAFLPEEFELQPVADLAADNRALLVAGASLPANLGPKAYLSIVTSAADRQSREKADLVLPDSWTGQLPLLLDTGRSYREINRQNAIISGGAGLVGLMLVLAGRISILAAAALSEIVNLAVALNAGRLTPPERESRTAEHKLVPVGPAPFGRSRSAREHAVSYELSPPLPLSELIQPRDWAQGLSQPEVARRLARFGPNLLTQRTPLGWFRLFAGQFKDVAALTLIGAGGVAATMGHLVDTLTILAILVLNAALGAAQEFKAERSMQALRRITAPTARVLRDGLIKIVGAAELVPGDCLLLEAGDRVPADALIVHGNGLVVEESMLTGESEPVTKVPFTSSSCLVGTEEAMAVEVMEPLRQYDPSRLDSPYLLFMGTNIVRGRCKAVVIATGMRAQMGRILNLVDAGGEVAPIQSHYKEVNKFLVTGSIVAAAIVSGAGMLTGRGTPLAMIMTGLSMAVAAIPEGLPTVVNIALSSGIQRMVGKGALVRRLSAMETLGGIDYICTDKTGTITGNHLTIQHICLMGQSLPADPLEPLRRNPDAAWAITVGMLCNDAAGDGQGGFSGDAVDVAFLEFGVKLGLDPGRLAAEYQRIRATPFESERRYMAIINKAKDGSHYLMVKGAPEKVLRCCTGYRDGGRILPLTQTVLDHYVQGCDMMASEAYRVIAVAYRREAEPPSDREAGADDCFEKDLVLAGLVGMIDPLRPGVAAAVSQCRQAGIKVAMISGDHPKTACAIAKSAGILDPLGKVLVGSELDRLDDAQFERIVAEIQVFARVKPAHKLRIVNALRKVGRQVIMTGDGVNDAPAVKWADVGIAMGAGTEVTKEAAAIVLVDDGFATIARAIDEGRNINGNVKAAMEFLVAGNFGEVIMMALAVLGGLPLPLLPLHILLVNLFTDGLPALGLALREPPREGGKRRPLTVRRFDQDPRFYARVTTRGVLSGATSLGAYLYALRAGIALDQARTIAFASIVACQFLQLIHWKAIGIERANWLRDDPRLRNIILLSWAGLLASIYTPGLARIFGLTPLNARDWLMVLLPVIGGSGIASYWEEKFDRPSTQLLINDDLKGGNQICQVTEEVSSPD